MFFKTASIPVVAVLNHKGSFSRRASKDLSDKDNQEIKKQINLIKPEIVASISKLYNISPNIKDYIYVVARALTADIPNQNGDCFPDSELTRYSHQHRCQVYSTFRHCPIHVEHCASDPKTARGFIPDCSYHTASQEDKHVLCLVAIDTTKDKPLAEGILSGKTDSFSMGCTCQDVTCSLCNKTAKNDRDLCEHLAFHKMRKVGGKLIYEICGGVEYQELSVVGTPADPTAKTQQILRMAAAQQLAKPDHWAPIASMLTEREQVELALYAEKNFDQIPDSLVKLLAKLF